MPVKIPVDKNLKDLVPRSDITFPIGVWTDVYRDFFDFTVNCHWHTDFEFGYVVAGPVDYYINNNYIKLFTGDCVFVNSNMLHMSRQPADFDSAKMFTVTFPAFLLTQNINSSLYEKYFQPMMSNRIEGFAVPSNNPFGQEMGTLLNEIYILDSSEFGYELECLKLISQLWMVTLRNIEDNKNSIIRYTGSMQHAERTKEILAYIHDHFSEKITVEDIAKQVNISRSECFRCFKRYLNKSPVEYINEYRLLNAVKLLRDTEISISDIYVECGFESASYFGKVFKESYGMTPMQYRRQR